MTQPFPVYDIAPGAKLDFGWDWAPELSKTGDSLFSSEWIVPDDLVVEDEEFTPSVAIIWLTAGELDSADRPQIYTAVNHVATEQGRKDQRTIGIRVIQT